MIESRSPDSVPPITEALLFADDVAPFADNHGAFTVTASALSILREEISGQSTHLRTFILREEISGRGGYLGQIKNIFPRDD